MSQVKNQPVLKFIKKNLTQPGLNPWCAGLARGFQPILTTLIMYKYCNHNIKFLSLSLTLNYILSFTPYLH